MATLARVTDVKLGVGEKGNTNNEKIKLYMEFADSFIYSKLKNVNGLILPITNPEETLRDLATLLSIAYFFKIESGDETLAEMAERNVDTWFDSNYNRPQFKAKSGGSI